MDPDPYPDPYWSPASTSGSGSVKNEYGSETLVPVPTFEKVMVPNPVPTFEKLRFRFLFQLHIQTVMVPVPTFEKVMVPNPVPTFEKLRFRFLFQLHIQTIKSKFFKKILEFFCLFT